MTRTRRMVLQGLLVSVSFVFPEVHAGASVLTWRPPAVQKVTATPSKAALVGKPVDIECVVGTAGEVKLDTNSPQGKYLSTERSPSWTVPVVIRVNGKVVGHFDDAGLSSLSSTWKHSAAWTPAAAEAGKPAVIECVADPVKKIFFSSKTLAIPILEKEIPKVRTKDQAAPAMKAVPPASVPVTPQR